MIKNILRINITNKDNTSCGSLIQHDDYYGNYMMFRIFQHILCENDSVPIDVVLEGGEPFIHKHLFLFLEYLNCIKTLNEITIVNHDITLFKKYYDNIKDISTRLAIPIKINSTISSCLLNIYPDYISICKNILSSILSESNLSLIFKVVYTSDEDKVFLENILKENNIPFNYCIFSIIHSYGNLSNSEYPIENINDTTIKCYASDGTNFGSDLVKRSEYELSLSSKKIPVFDSINHVGLWISSIAFLSDISFESKDTIELSLEIFQKNYIEEHINEYTIDMLDKNIYSYSEYYASLFDDDLEHSPFFEYSLNTVKNMELEVLLLSKLMKITQNVTRFYQYKNYILKLCYEIAHLPINKNIKTTDDCCMCEYE